MALEVFSDMSERLNYNLPGFPIYARKGELRHFDKYTAACHWHPDLEFILILEGSMDYFVNGQILHINKGEGIFVNGKRLHYGYSKNNCDCTFLCVVVHPALLGDGTHTGKAYIDSKFGSVTEDCILLTGQSDWQREALSSIPKIYGEMHTETQNPLRLISQITSLCAYIGDNIQPASMQYAEHSLLSVWNMTGYIQKNYSQKILISDIAAAGSVCRSRCCKLFNEYIGQTPNTYLIRYRIQKSCEMLTKTNMSVIEISMACGFQSPSYFIQVFQKENGLTPRDYRNKFM
jgi:AraC family transcriptional regulator, melibiose operon regulatory protein